MKKFAVGDRVVLILNGRPGKVDGFHKDRAIVILDKGIRAGDGIVFSGVLVHPDNLTTPERYKEACAFERRCKRAGNKSR